MTSQKKSSVKKAGGSIAGLEKQLAVLRERLQKLRIKEAASAQKAAKKAKSSASKSTISKARASKAVVPKAKAAAPKTKAATKAATKPAAKKIAVKPAVTKKAPAIKTPASKAAPTKKALDSTSRPVPKVDVANKTSPITKSKSKLPVKAPKEPAAVGSSAEQPISTSEQELAKGKVESKPTSAETMAKQPAAKLVPAKLTTDSQLEPEQLKPAKPALEKSHIEKPRPAAAPLKPAAPLNNPPAPTADNHSDSTEPGKMRSLFDPIDD